MKRYAYVLVRSDGASHNLSRDQHFLTAGQLQNDLLGLLADGWTPVRETPLGGIGPPGSSSYVFCLTLLEKNI
jgi:hypothetical protein